MKRGAQKGNTQGFKKGGEPWNKGIKIDKEKYPTMGHTQKHSDETRKKMRIKKLGIKRKKFTEETLKKMRNRTVKPETIEKLRDRCGRKNPNWKEEKSDRKYAVDWSRTLRRSIRERDKYTCKLCGEQQTDKAHAVHHINYDKNNCNPDNLITLCQSCHSKTTWKREYYKNLLTNLI